MARALAVFGWCLLLASAFSFGRPVSQETRKVSVEALVYDLKHPDPERRKQAAAALGQNRIRSAAPALAELAADPDDSVRLEAARALVSIGDPGSVEAFVRLSGDSRREIRSLAVEGIVQTYTSSEGGFFQGVRKIADFVNPFSDDYNPKVVEPFVQVDPAAVDALSRLLSDPESSIRRDAALALGILRAHSALPAIQSRLSEETDEDARVELIRAIYKIGDPAAASGLVPLIRDPSKKVHDEAIFTVGRLRVPEAVQPMKELYESGVEERRKIFKIVPVSGTDDLQRNLLQSLSYIGDPTCKDLFLAALDDTRVFFRRYGAEGLGRLGDPDTTTPVARAYLRESSSNAKLAMSFALYRLGRQEHLDELVANVGKDQALNYLLEFDSAQVAKLYPYLGLDVGQTARLFEVIGSRGDRSALPIAEKFSASPETSIASAANTAIRRLRARLGEV